MSLFLHERVRKQIRIGPVTKLFGSDCSDVQLVAVEEEAEKIVVTKQNSSTKNYRGKK